MNEVTVPCFWSQARVYFEKKENEFHDFGSVVTDPDKILQAVLSGADSFNLWFFMCDFKRMKLVDRTTGKETDILMEFRWDPRSLLFIVGDKRNRKLTRQVLIMALDRIRSQPSLKKILKLKGLRTCEIRENPYLRQGHPPHDNFVESLLDFFDNETVDGSKPTLFEHFLESSVDDERVESFNAMEQGGIRTVFHGTNHAVMDAILLSGLDPNCRREDLTEDYFGVSFGISLEYTKRKTVPPPARFKLLVFMVLNPVERGACLTVESNTFELPIAEITLC